MASSVLVIIVISVIILLLIIWVISIYNSLVALKNNIDKSFSNIDVMLKQRFDELTKMLDTVKGYMQYETDLLTKITQARTSFLNSNTIAEKVESDNMMTSAMKSLFAVSENYPDLKANENFIFLQNRISSMENELSDKRETYNDDVNSYNIKIEQLPNNIIANMFNFTKKELFKIDEESKKDVKMNF